MPDDSRASPYCGPRPFERADRAVFFGRTRERDDLVDLIFAYRCVLLYAQSGSGKTSLVNAGLIPELEAKGVTVLPVGRVSGEVPPDVTPDSIHNVFGFNLLASVLQRATTDPEATTARYDGTEVVSGLALPGAAPDAPPRLLIIDQFEELFRTHPERWHERMPFCEQLRDAMRADRTLRLLLVLREDYLAELDPFAERFPDGLRIRFRLERLGETQALEAIRKPAERRGWTFDKDVAEGLVSNLRRIEVEVRVGTRIQTQSVDGPFVEPVQLQVVCDNIWARLPPNPPERRIPASAAQTADVNQALGTFYERAVVKVHHDTLERTYLSEGDLRKWIATQLITPAGTRGIVYQGETHTAGLPNATIWALEKERIVRSEPRAGGTWYELTHDRFIRPIRESNGAFNQRQRQQVLRRLRWVAAIIVLGLGTFMYFTFQRATSSTMAAGKQVAALDKLSWEAVNAGSYDRAIEGFSGASATYEALGDSARQARALLGRAYAEVENGNVDRAATDLRRALPSYRADLLTNVSDRLDDATALHVLGRAFYKSGDVSLAASALERAEEHYRTAANGDSSEAAWVETFLSLTYARLGDYSRAQDAFARALRFYGSAGERKDHFPNAEKMIASHQAWLMQDPQTTQAYHNLSRLQLLRGEAWPAVQTIDKGIAAAASFSDKILVPLKLSRLKLLDEVAKEATPPLDLREYLCRHNAYVVGASERAENADGEIKRFLRQFPVASKGQPNSGWVPIVVDAYLTCDETSALLKQVQDAFHTSPFYLQHSTTCSACAGLPGTVRRQ